MLRWKHAYVGAYSENLFGRDCIAVEGSAIKQDEISSLTVHLDAVLQFLFLLVFFWDQKPVLLESFHLLLHEVRVMIVVRPWNADEASLFRTGVCESHYPLIAPELVFGGRLVNMEKGVYRNRFIVSGSIHETKTIERAFDVFSFPYLLEKRQCSLS